MATRALNVVITGDVKGFQAALAKAAGASGAFAAKQKTIGGKLTSFGTAVSKRVTLPLIAAGAVSVKFAADFEKQMSAVGAVTNARGRDMGRLRKQALTAGQALGFTAMEVGRAQTELAKGGVSTQKILSGGLRAALVLARAGELDLADAASITANALNLFGLKGKDATRVADAMATAANATTADVADFGMALSQSGTIAKSAGLSFTDTMVVLEALAKIGVKNSDAGTSMKAAFIQLLKPSKKQAAVAKELNLSFLDQNHEMKSLAGISGMLRDKLGGMTKAQRTATLAQLAGTDGVRTLTAIYNAGPNTLERYARSLDKSGVAADVARKKQQNLSGDVSRLKSSLTTLGIVVGTALIPPLTSLAQHATSIGQTLAHAFSSLPPGMQQTVLAVAGGVAALGPLVFIVGRTVSAFAKLKKGLVVLSAIRGFGFLSALGPVGAAAAGVLALSIAIRALTGHESAEASAARNVAAAKRDELKAMQDLAGVERAAGSARLAAQQATLNVTRSEQTLSALRGQGKRGTVEYKQAELDLRQAKLDSLNAHRSYTAELTKQNVVQQSVVHVTNERVAATRKALDIAKQNLAVEQRGLAAATRAGEGEKGLAERRRAIADLTSKLTSKQRDYNAALDSFATKQAQARLSDLNRARASQGLDRITGKNIMSTSTLIAALQKVPKNVRTKILADSADALGKTGTLVGRLYKLGKGKTVTHILATSKNADDATSRLRVALARIDKQKATARIHADSRQATHAVSTINSQIERLAQVRVSLGPLNASVASGLSSVLATAESFSARIRAAIQHATDARKKGSPSLVEDTQAGMRALTAAATGGLDELAGGIRAKSATVRKAGKDTVGGFVFELDAQIAAAQKASDALQALFTRTDKQREVDAARRRASRPIQAAVGKNKDKIKQRNDDIKQARKELAQLHREALRTNQLAAIDFKVTGLERLKAFNGAIGDIRDSLSGLVDSAVSAFRDMREKAIDRELSGTLLALDTSFAGALERQRKGLGADPRVAELAGIRARQQGADQAAEDADVADRLAKARLRQAKADEQARKAQEGLARVEGAGSPRLIADATRRLALAQAAQGIAAAGVASVEADQRKLADTRRADELEAELDNARTIAEDRANAVRDGLDLEVADFQAATQAKLDIETAQLEARKQGYAKFVDDVQAILGPLGVVFATSADAEAALGALAPTLPGAAPGTGKPKAKAKPKRKPAHHHRATGGTVMDRLGEFARLNEVGKETVFLPRGTVVDPAWRTARRERHNGPLIGEVHIHEANRLDEQALAAKLGFDLSTRRR